MKSVFVIISKDVIRRNILDTDFWTTFLSHLPAGWKAVLIVEKEKVADYSLYKSERVEVCGYQKVGHSGFQKILNYLIRTGVNSHSTRTYRNRAYLRGSSSFVSFITKAFVANTLGSLGFFKNFSRFLFLKTKAPKEVYEIFDRYKPDAIFAPSLIDNEFDAQFGRVAKQRGVKFVGMVRSWDNLNNHGILSVVPDVWPIQNRFLFEAAKKYQAINLDKIKTIQVGLPHYDLYKDPSSIIKPKVEFMEALGLDQDRSFVLLGGSDFYYSENTLPKKIDEAIESGAIRKKIQIIFRPHPGSIFSLEEYGLESLKNVTLDNAFSGKQLFSDTDKFINLLYHADIIINICSTLSIDAAVFDKPAICINFDDKENKLSHFESVHRLYDHFDHYERLIAMNGVQTPTSMNQLVKAINEYLEDPTKDFDGRKRIIEEFVAPLDGKAGERLAKTVVKNI